MIEALIRVYEQGVDNGVEHFVLPKDVFEEVLIILRHQQEQIEKYKQIIRCN